MKDDTISRKAAIDAVNEYLRLSEVSKTVQNMTSIQGVLRRLPSAQPEQRWIPCSERLPKPFEHCLWTTTDGRVVYHHCDGLFSNYTAWMPLPEPYGEGT